MKKLEGLTLTEIEEKWVDGARYQRQQTNNFCYTNPLSITGISGKSAVAKDWILELPDAEPMTKEQLFNKKSKSHNFKVKDEPYANFIDITRICETWYYEGWHDCLANKTDMEIIRSMKIKKPMTDDEILLYIEKDSAYFAQWDRPDTVRGIKMARQSERLRYQRLVNVLNAFMDKYCDQPLNWVLELNQLLDDIRDLKTILEEVENEII